MNGKELANLDDLEKKVKLIANRAESRWRLGKMDGALELIEKGETLLTSFSGEWSKEMKRLHCVLLGTKSVTSIIKGNLHIGLECAKDIEQIAQEIDDKSSLAGAMYLFASYYLFSGDLVRSLEYYDRCIELRRDINEHPLALADALMCATSTAVYNGELERAREYFKRLEEFYEEVKSQDSTNLIYFCYVFAKAFILKSSSRFRDRVMAEELFKEIIEKKAFHANMDVLSLIFLCELLLNELRVTNDVGIVNEIEPLITKLMYITQKRKSYLYLVEACLLQGKIELLTFKIKKARRSFVQAQRMAERSGANFRAQEIADLQEDLGQQLEMWDYLKETNAPFSKRMELARLSCDLSEIIRSRVERIEQKEVTVYKDSKTCVVCKGNAGGFNIYVCPQCNSIYCKGCAKAVVEIENACWTCESPIDIARPSKPFEEEKITIETKDDKKSVEKGVPKKVGGAEK